MTHRLTLLAGAAALAFAGPAVAQNQVPSGAMPEGVPDAAAPSQMSWQDVSRPNVRFVQRDGQGNIVFDSGAAGGAPGASGAMADRIEAADAPTTGETDAMGDGGATAAMTEDEAREPVMELADQPPVGQSASGSQDMARSGDATAGDDATRRAGDESAQTDQAQPMQGTGTSDGSAAGGSPGGMMASDGSGSAAQADDATPRAGGSDMAASGSGDRLDDGRSMTGGDQHQDMAVDEDGSGQVPGAGVPFDLDEFAREMYEQGYRQGYVSGMTQMRAGMARRMRDAERVRGERFRQQARDQREGMRQAIPNAYDDGQGGTVIVLPRGMSPRQFMEQLSQRP